LCICSTRCTSKTVADYILLIIHLTSGFKLNFSTSMPRSCFKIIKSRKNLCLLSVLNSYNSRTCLPENILPVVIHMVLSYFDIVDLSGTTAFLRFQGALGLNCILHLFISLDAHYFMQ
ncbi:hypothetical protein T4A_9156, partial [Trichinella pseudospiralis]